MKTYDELINKHVEISESLETIFGAGGTISDYLYEVMRYVTWAHDIIEESKTAGVFDAVMQERERAEISALKLENKRLVALLRVDGALKYMQNVKKIGGGQFDYYFQGVRNEAASQLRDEVTRFLDTFGKVEG